MSRHHSTTPATKPEAVPSPELEQVLCDLQSPDDWTRASAVRQLCPCRRKDWGVPVYRYVVAMRDDPSPIVRGAVRHDLSENQRWNESWESALIQERRARRVRVTLAVKATALADLCERLREETGLPLWSEPAVADEKLTLFCRQMPLRHVMRQIGRSLGYAWEWQTKGDAGHLELRRDPEAARPQKAGTPARRVRDHRLRARVSLPLAAGGDGEVADEGAARRTRVTSADLLEALHRATGLPIVADFYTRLVTVVPAALADRPLRALLDDVARTMRLRWQFAEGAGTQGESWVQFRSLWGHYEQLQEVPNRRLALWSELQRQVGHLPLEALMEIAALPHAQRTGEEMAEGAREIWGLAEWPLATGDLSAHLRFLGALSPVQQAQAARGDGVPLHALSAAQQQQFLSLPLPDGARPCQAALAETYLRVEYHPGSRLEFRYQLGDGAAGPVVRCVATEHGVEVLGRPTGGSGR